MAKKLRIVECLKKKTNQLPQNNEDQQDTSQRVHSNFHPVENRSISTSDFYYKTNNTKIGIALIFNHFEYDNNFLVGNKEITKRHGNKEDTKNIIESLENYGFDVWNYPDYKKNEIMETLNKVSQDENNKNKYDCLVVVVMTHGIEGGLYAKDECYKIEKLWEPFYGENCTSFINKPKLFFIQACRGFGMDKKAIYHDGISPSKNNTYIIPSSADILIMYSTQLGKFSCRNTVDGTWFIQSLSKLLNDYVKLEGGIDLLHLLTLVNRKVAYEYETNMLESESIEYKDMTKQMPNFTSTLTKFFILKAKK